MTNAELIANARETMKDIWYINNGKLMEYEQNAYNQLRLLADRLEQVEQHPPLIDQGILIAAIEKWGAKSQANKIQEELLELALALNRINCSTKDQEEMEENIYEELADVKIMMAQAELIFNKSRIDEMVKIKLEKLKKHLDNEKRN